MGLFRPAAKRRRNIALGMAGDRAGATAVEFAMVAPVLLPLLLGIVEAGILFVTNVCLDSAVASFAIQIRTGQIQAPGTAATTSSGTLLDLGDAKTWICQNMPMAPLSTCTAQLQLDVRPLSSYQGTMTASPVSNGTFSTSGFCYYSGNAGDLVQIRSYYLFSTIDPLLMGTLATVTSYMGTSGKFVPLTATQVFRAETYPAVVNTGAGC